MPRLTPYDLAFGPDSEPRFAEIRESLAREGRDPHDADAFVLDREVAALLRSLVPEEGVGEAVREHIALLHHAYLYWSEGGWLIRPSRERVRELLTEAPAAESADGLPRAFYVQVPERLVWLAFGPGEPHQPLDGLFVRPWPGGGLFVLAVAGMHPGSEGFTVAEVDGHPAEALEREDGSPLFAPVLPGGREAGLFSVAGGEELLELGRRCLTIAREAVACAGPAQRAHQAVEVG
jgi:hypothetical protein